MYRTGDKVLYPMHGAGVIRQIERCEILGEVKDYYLLHVPCGDMEVMIPVEACDDIGVRRVGTQEEVDEAISVLGLQSAEISGNWSKRYRANTEKLKTGDMNLVAEVVRDLTRHDRVSGLSAGEKKMLSNARKILQSEIMLALDISEDEALEMIEGAI
ncbi:MAG: CarD family transcriptional regulator [Firmicutes bacterium]|nr:CarD family transcriptional regulator [Bacillota bacterium]